MVGVVIGIIMVGVVIGIIMVGVVIVLNCLHVPLGFNDDEAGFSLDLKGSCKSILMGGLCLICKAHHLL